MIKTQNVIYRCVLFISELYEFGFMNISTNHVFYFYTYFGYPKEFNYF